MLKFCIEKWDKNKDKLKQDIANNIKQYNSYYYNDLLKKVVEIILNDEETQSRYNQFNTEEITEINDGDYQGTLLFLIPKNTYQPSASDYLMTYVYYGSCSGCDTLQSIQSWGDTDKMSDESKATFVEDYMTLCLHLIQNMKMPFNINEIEV